MPPCRCVRGGAVRAAGRLDCARTPPRACRPPQLLLPELESGLVHPLWRIRASSVLLLGDLLYRIAGVTGKGTTESAADEGCGTEGRSS